MTRTLPPAPPGLVSHETVDTITDPDLLELAEQLGDLPVAYRVVEPSPWWDDEPCGHCPEPFDALGPFPRPAVAYVCYRGLRGLACDHTYRDTVCPGCLYVAVHSKLRCYREVWIEIPAPICTCDPTRGQSCEVCSGDLFAEVTAEEPA